MCVSVCVFGQNVYMCFSVVWVFQHGQLTFRKQTENTRVHMTLFDTSFRFSYFVHYCGHCLTTGQRRNGFSTS